MPDLVKKDGGTLHYDVHQPTPPPGPGNGPSTILLIEGLGAHMIAWREGFWQHFLDAGHQVVRFDNRDVGRSQRYPDAGYSLRDLARDTHELIQHLDLAPLHVVGQSMGGMIAQHLAIDHPEDVASLTLLYTTSSPHHLAADRGVEAMRSAPRASRREEAAALHLAGERICASTSYSFDETWRNELGALIWDRGYDPDGAVRQCQALLTDVIRTAALTALTTPTLVVHGTADALIPAVAGKELHDLIPASELWLVDGLGHDIPPEIWQDLATRILQNARRTTRTDH
jgi:pimeloyl-ACP methyl ester carboxylesterase